MTCLVFYRLQCTNVVAMFHRSRVKWTLAEIQRMPQTILKSRITAAGGDISEFECTSDTNRVFLAPTLGVREGQSNPVVR